MNKYDFKFTPPPPDKYTVEEFMPIFNERERKLFEDYKTLTVEEPNIFLIGINLT